MCVSKACGIVYLIGGVLQALSQFSSRSLHGDEAYAANTRASSRITY